MLEDQVVLEKEPIVDNEMRRNDEEIVEDDERIEDDVIFENDKDISEIRDDEDATSERGPMEPFVLENHFIDSSAINDNEYDEEPPLTYRRELFLRTRDGHKRIVTRFQNKYIKEAVEREENQKRVLQYQSQRFESYQKLLDRVKTPKTRATGGMVSLKIPAAERYRKFAQETRKRVEQQQRRYREIEKHQQLIQQQHSSPNPRKTRLALLKTHKRLAEYDPDKYNRRGVVEGKRTAPIRKPAIPKMKKKKKKTRKSREKRRKDRELYQTELSVEEIDGNVADNNENEQEEYEQYQQEDETYENEVQQDETQEMELSPIREYQEAGALTDSQIAALLNETVESTTEQDKLPNPESETQNDTEDMEGMNEERQVQNNPEVSTERLDEEENTIEDKEVSSDTIEIDEKIEQNTEGSHVEQNNDEAEQPSIEVQHPTDVKEQVVEETQPDEYLVKENVVDQEIDEKAEDDQKVEEINQSPQRVDDSTIQTPEKHEKKDVITPTQETNDMEQTPSVQTPPTQSLKTPEENRTSLTPQEIEQAALKKMEEHSPTVGETIDNDIGELDDDEIDVDALLAETGGPADDDDDDDIDVDALLEGIDLGEKENLKSSLLDNIDAEVSNLDQIDGIEII